MEEMNKENKSSNESGNKTTNKLNDELGIIISGDDSPNTDYYYFVVNENAIVKKGMYVSAVFENNEIIGYVDLIQTSNKYYEFIEGIQGYEKPDEALPIQNWHKTIARVSIHGIKSGKYFKRVDYPPKPGSRVVKTNDKTIATFLGFSKNELHLGNVRHHNVDADLSMTRMLQKHLAILAMSGAGKSHLTSVLIEELLDRPKEMGRIAVVVIDVHGEYLGFREDTHYGGKTNYFNGTEMKFSFRDIHTGEMAQLGSGITGAGMDVLTSVISKLKSENKSYDVDDVINQIKAHPESGKNVKDALLRAMYRIKGYRLFSKNEDYPDLEKTIEPGKLTILDLSDLINDMQKKAIVYLIAEKMFHLRMQKKIPPFLLIIEEAHNFAKMNERSETAIARGIIEKIAREGRKFGAALCIISQRPSNLSATALSQCNTHIIMRMTNPNDLDYIKTDTPIFTYH